jgi:2-amino-4-hydroxy-6-hydroxymethyldihydropteridine diphosphokinase
MKHNVYIALGSNLGDRLANLGTALVAIRPEVSPVECSPVYETQPWGFLEQQNFLNQVILAKTSLSPWKLLEHLKKVEKRLGREKTFRYGPRLIDLDILFFDSDVIDSPPLQIPHPEIQNRAFVLFPLAQLAPEYLHPVLNMTVEEMLGKLDVAHIDLHSPGGCGLETG